MTNRPNRPDMEDLEQENSRLKQRVQLMDLLKAKMEEMEEENLMLTRQLEAFINSVPTESVTPESRQGFHYKLGLLVIEVCSETGEEAEMGSYILMGPEFDFESDARASIAYLSAMDIMQEKGGDGEQSA